MEPNLKQQFPLSPRKFWKKIIEKSILFLVLAFLIAVPGILLLQVILKIQYSTGVMLAISIPVGIVLFFIITAIYGVYVRYYIKTYYYSDDSDFLTIKKGVFAPTEIHVQYLKIQDVFVDQDILDRIMGLYDVHISSATYSSGIEAHIDGVEKNAANGLKELLLGKIKRSTSHQQPVAGNTHQTPSESPVQKVNFSSPISSDVYGLSSDWWIGEIVKIALAAVFTPLVIAVWMYFSMLDESTGRTVMTLSGWRGIFYVWLAAFVLTILSRSIYLYLWKMHYKYEFGDEYIYMKVGVLSVSEKNMGYNTVQDVKVNQSITDRIFGVADVIIENASPGMPMNVGNKQMPLGANGIVIEGLELEDARKVADEMKAIIRNRATIAKGL